MTTHAKKSSHLQAVDRTKTATVEIPLPLLGAFAGIERSYFDLCIRAGQQVLDALMEQDREELCGPRWKRDPARQAGIGSEGGLPLPSAHTTVRTVPYTAVQVLRCRSRS